MKNLLEVIEGRKEQEECLKRLHIALNATATTKAIAAAFDNREITLEDLIGKPPGASCEAELASDADTNGIVAEWRQAAREKGLKTTSEEVN